MERLMCRVQEHASLMMYIPLALMGLSHSPWDMKHFWSLGRELPLRDAAHPSLRMMALHPQRGVRLRPREIPWVRLLLRAWEPTWGWQG